MEKRLQKTTQPFSHLLLLRRLHTRTTRRKRKRDNNNNKKRWLPCCIRKERESTRERDNIKNYTIRQDDDGELLFLFNRFFQPASILLSHAQLIDFFFFRGSYSTQWAETGFNLCLAMALVRPTTLTHG